MSEFDLMSVVQPSSGWFAIVGMDSSGTRQRIVETRAEADKIVDSFTEQGKEVYFGVAKYKDGSSRTKDNVDKLKSLWVDLDCGEKKPYADQAEGLDALITFCRTVGMPYPIVVNSGRGLHVYWPLIEELERPEWEPLMAKLQTACAKHDLKPDPSCFEAARILRVPGTFNFKGGEPKEVTVLQTAKPSPLEKIKSALSAFEEYTRGFLVERPLSPLMLQHNSNMESRFEEIMKLSLNGKGCDQLADCYKNRATLEYNRWFDALSIAAFCSDKDEAIHAISAGHPGYEPGQVETVANGIKGPHHCTTFERNNPGGCRDCKFKDRITSPISLSKRLKEKADTPQIISDDIIEEIPKPPDPYKRGINGGIYRSIEVEDGIVEELVYEYDLIVMERVYTAGTGGSLVVRVKFPKDGVRQFFLPETILYNTTELRKLLNREEVVPENAKKFQALQDYLVQCMRSLQSNKEAKTVHTQFGWSPNMGSFLIGNRLITSQGTKIAELLEGGTMERMAEKMRPEGSLDKWKEVMAIYGEPGHEDRAFAVATGIGSILMPLTGQTGGLISVVHPNSGTGKTTILRSAMSMWGLPTEKKGLVYSFKDTSNARVLKMGYHHHLPYCVDEMSNAPPWEISNAAYEVTQGEGKERMEASRNQLRENTSSWNLMMLASSNAPFYQKLEELKALPEGEMMRVIEYPIGQSNIIDPAYARNMFDYVLPKNYGHAGPMAVRYAIQNLERVEELRRQMQDSLEKTMGIVPKERIWSSLISCNLTAVYILNYLDLVEWSLENVFKFSNRLIRDLRRDIKQDTLKDLNILGEYLNSVRGHILVINGKKNNLGLYDLPKNENDIRGEINVRWEPDMQRCYIQVSSLKRFCSERMVNYKDLIATFKRFNVYKGTETMRIGAGSTADIGSVHCIVLDSSHPQIGVVDAIPLVNVD